MELFKSWLWGNIDFNDYESGGQKCFDYMSTEFRLFFNIMMPPIYFIAIDYLSNKKNKKESENAKAPSMVEALFGYLSLFVYIFTIFLKIRSKALMYIFNPCHTIGLLQGICLICKSSNSMKFICNISNNLLFCCASALFTPLLTGLDSIEVFFFFYEHWEVLLLNPLIIILGGRYFDEETFKTKTSIAASCFFGLYQRIFLYPLGWYSHVNLDYILCPSLGDPFIPYVGKWYYTLSDFYLGFICYLTTRLIEVIYKIKVCIEGLLEKKDKKE